MSQKYRKVTSMSKKNYFQGKNTSSLGGKSICGNIFALKNYWNLNKKRNSVIFLVYFFRVKKYHIIYKKKDNSKSMRYFLLMFFYFSSFGANLHNDSFD